MRIAYPTMIAESEEELAAGEQRLADLGSAWGAATPAERNKLARQRFGTTVVSIGTAVAPLPWPDLAPFFAVNRLVESGKGGSDGDRFSTFKTFPVGRSAWRCPIFGPFVPQSRPGGQAVRGVAIPLPLATGGVRAS